MIQFCHQRVTYMRLRFVIGSLLFGLVTVAQISAQPPARPTSSPVTIQDIRRSLRFTPEIPAHIQRTNSELIAAIKLRGVDFALSKEEEWALGLMEASDDLIAAIRNSMSPEERERRLRAREQEGIYYTFAQNQGRSDVASKRIAAAAGRDFLARYSSDASVAEKVSYIRKTLPALDRSIRTLERSVRRTRRRSN
ncbi:MAG: hypothetical protein AB7P09_08710 [Pyrinomonadaceae bacterium]